MNILLVELTEDVVEGRDAYDVGEGEVEEGMGVLAVLSHSSKGTHDGSSELHCPLGRQINETTPINWYPSSQRNSTIESIPCNGASSLIMDIVPFDSSFSGSHVISVLKYKEYLVEKHISF